MFDYEEILLSKFLGLEHCLQASIVVHFFLRKLRVPARLLLLVVIGDLAERRLELPVQYLLIADYLLAKRRSQPS